MQTKNLNGGKFGWRKNLKIPNARQKNGNIPIRNLNFEQI
jgi:hypothetical protein